MVSEDELSEDKSMENVSDDELPATAQPLPETEDLSEDELTVDKKKKVISDSPTPGSEILPICFFCGDGAVHLNLPNFSHHKTDVLYSII